MSRKGLEKAFNFIKDICAQSSQKQIEINIGKFSKYRVYVLSDDEPCFYIEFIGETIWDDILYRFNLLKPEFDGIGEFEEWSEFNDFLMENWATIILRYNLLNNTEIPNKGIFTYN